MSEQLLLPFPENKKEEVFNAYGTFPDFAELMVQLNEWYRIDSSVGETQ